jgi:hypothetical protein
VWIGVVLLGLWVLAWLVFAAEAPVRNPSIGR